MEIVWTLSLCRGTGICSLIGAGGHADPISLRYSDEPCKTPVWDTWQPQYYQQVWSLTILQHHMEWPRKNATPTINNFKNTRMTMLCGLMKEFWFYGLLWGNVIFKIRYFHLKSHNCRPENVIVWLPRVKCLFLLCKTKTSWIKRNIRYVTFQCYVKGELLK